MAEDAYAFPPYQSRRKHRLVRPPLFRRRKPAAEEWLARLRADAARPRRWRLPDHREYRLIALCIFLLFAAVWIGRPDDPDLATPGDYAPSNVGGRARIVDGDTLDFSGTRVRLSGIDAPESGQSCRDRHGATYACGHTARTALAEKIAGQDVRCEAHGTDRYRRRLAYCFIGDLDLNEWMVREGHALAYWRYSWRYLPAELAARMAGRGIWQGEFKTPEDWRHSRRAAR